MCFLMCKKKTPKFLLVQKQVIIQCSFDLLIPFSIKTVFSAGKWQGIDLAWVLKQSIALLSCWIDIVAHGVVETFKDMVQGMPLHSPIARVS